METKVLSRGWKFEVESSVAATFTEVKGITKFGIKRKKKDADQTDFKSAGNEEHVVASRSTEITLDGYYLEDPTTKARDAGQTRLEEIAELVGPASVVNWKITSPGGKLWTFKGSASTGDIGGGNDDNTSWGGTITVSGVITKA